MSLNAGGRSDVVSMYVSASLVNSFSNCLTATCAQAFSLGYYEKGLYINSHRKILCNYFYLVWVVLRLVQEFVKMLTALASVINLAAVSFERFDEKNINFDLRTPKDFMVIDDSFLYQRAC